MSGVKHLLADPLTPVVLSSMRPHRFGHDLIEGILFGGHAYAFYQAIEQAKIDLSTTDRTSIEFHRRGLDVSVPFTRMELDSLVFPFLDTVARQIRTALEQAGIGTGDVSMVLRTGGSSRLGAFVDMLEAMFGADRVREREAYTSVANGLGVVAQELWS